MPGIDFTNDPLLQGRLFSYTDTQLIRLGGPELPRDPDQPPDRAARRTTSATGSCASRSTPVATSYQPNSLGGDVPAQVPAAAGGYVTYPEPTEGAKVRARGASFFDHYSQARMFFQSQSEPEQQHLIKALRFELGKVETPDDPRADGRATWRRSTDRWPSRSPRASASSWPERVSAPPNLSVPADGDPADFQHRELADRDVTSPP